MLHSTDYQRYKQKLERLQNKVKKSEAARKELEIKFQRLMKERNECEKAATIHKSKYASLLEQERKRMNRNEKLLHMLEEIDAKAASLATKTERLKILKTQQEFILMNSWRQNDYLLQQSILSNAGIPNDGISSIFKCTQPIDHSCRFFKSTDIDRNENVRYGVSSNQQLPFETNVKNSSEAEKFINNTLNQQQILDKLYHSQQYPSSSMPFYHCNEDQRQYLMQHIHVGSPQQSDQYELTLPSLATQQTTYGAGYPVPVTNQQNSKTLSMSTLSSYQLPMKIEKHSAYYPNFNRKNIINSNLIDVGTNRNESKLSTIPVKEKFIASTAPPITTNKLTSDENTRSISNEKALHFDNGIHTYSSIKNFKNEFQQPPIHYQGQRSHFSSMPGMATMLPMEDSRKTIDAITSTAQLTNLISRIPSTSAPMNIMAIIHTPHIQSQPNTTHNQTTCNNIRTNIGSVGLYENENENCALSTSNIIQHNKNDKNNSEYEDDQRWQNNIVNDDYKISETFANPINVKTSVLSSSFEMDDDNIINNKTMISTSRNMNNIGMEMTLPKQTTQPPYSHSVNRIEKNDNYQYNEFADYASRECHATAPVNESHFKDKMANETNNRGHITDADIAPSALFTRWLEEKRHLNIDSGIPLKACDDDVLLLKKANATNNVRRRYSVASNLPQNFEPFYLSNAFALKRTQNANFDSEKIEQIGGQREKAEPYHHQDDKDGNSNSKNGNDNDNDKDNDDDVLNPNSNPGNKYENGNLNMFTTSLGTRQIIEPTTILNLKQVNPTPNANLWQNDGIIASNDQRSSVTILLAEAAPPPLDIINSQTMNMTAFIYDVDDDANQNQTTDINQNNVYIVEPDNVQQSRPFTTNQILDDQTFIEKPMEQLKLVNDIEDVHNIDQFNPINDGNEKIRISTSHSKTVTWADDPYNRYKKDDAEPQFYDSDNIDNSSSNHIYTDEANQLQQYQTTDPNNYVDIVETTNPANSCVYQYNLNQNLYHSQVDASDQNESENQGYYYADSDQNGIDQQMQPEQQGLQNAFYEQTPGEYMIDTITNDGNTMCSATEQLSDDYQKYPIDSMPQVQPQQDAYYSETPGKNYHTEYTDDDQNQQYFLEVNTDQAQQQQQQYQQIDNTTNVGRANDERIHNYLQSDTDDSQITDRNQNAQYQDSDFDLSTNS